MLRIASSLVVGAVVTFAIGNSVAAPVSRSAPDNSLAPLGQRALEALKAPELAVSRCMLSPVFSSDNATVAISTDRVFMSNDVLIAIANEPVDPTAKMGVRDLLMKHTPTEKLPVKVRRVGAELTVNAACTDSKPFYDLFLEAAYAASNSDAATCADKMTAAGQLHGFNFGAAELSFQCRRVAGRIVGTIAQAQGFYELRRLAILESAWSPDALGRIRGMILTAVDILQKNNSALLANDLKQQYDDAVAKSAAPPVTSAASQQ